MYISEISGHRSAAIAIEKALKDLQPGTEILNINAFNYTNPIAEKVVNRIYMSVIKSTPQIWEYLYDNPKVMEKISKLKKNLHNVNSPKFKILFDKFKPDAVICTQAFPCGMVADFKEVYNSNLPLIAVLTDYVPHAYWVYDKINYYITPCEEVTKQLMQKSVPLDKIKTFGIPFDNKFNKSLPRNEIIRKLKLKPDVPILLIMGGGQGLGPIKTIVKSLEKSKIEFQELIVTGINKKLYKSLNKKIAKCKKRILLFGFVDNINELMGVADIIITKPGGITTAEALTKGVPMIIVKPIPGQEANNSRYLTEKGVAIKIDKPKEITNAIETLLKNPEKLNAMRQATKDIAKPHSSIDTAKLILSL